MNDEKRMRLRYDGVCRVCEAALPATTEAIYERSIRTVRCVAHAVETEPGFATEKPTDPGTPGASARREFERRKAGRERRIRASHPKLGGLIHALSEEPQSTTSWDIGATGEERLGAQLNDLAPGRVHVLHDRRVPGTRANIDHLAITPTGIYVIDAKKYAGRPRLQVEGGILRARTEKLLVGRRDCSKLVDGVLRQIDVVGSVLDAKIPVRGVLCFIAADWPLIGGSFTTRGVDVVWPRKLYSKLEADGPLGGDAIESITRALAERLKPA